MRRATAKVLVLFILFGNVAWAADIHEAASAPAAAHTGDYDHSGGQSDPGHDPQHDGSSGTPCDHCCHGAAHYLGFPPKIHFALFATGSCAPALRVAGYRSRAKEPPLPPPNI